MSLSTKIKDMVSNKEEKTKLFKNTDGVLDKLLEELGEGELAHHLIANKIISDVIIAKMPKPIGKECLEQSFNPGTAGILTLADNSSTHDVDALICDLIHKFKTNAYDAAFVKQIINAASHKELTKTCATLLEMATDADLLIEDIKKTSFRLFCAVIEHLPENLALRASAHFSIDDTKDIEKIPEKDVIKLLDNEDAVAVLKKSGSKFHKLLTEHANDSSTSDKHYQIALAIITNYGYGVSSNSIQYRECAEGIVDSKYSYVLKGVLESSNFFMSAFIAGSSVEIDHESAYLLLSGKLRHKTVSGYGRRNSRDQLIEKVLQSGTDTQLSSQITKRPDIFKSYVLGNALTPSVLAKSIPSNMEETAKAIYELSLGASYKKAISDRFTSLKGASTGASIAEVHDNIWHIMQREDGKKFMEAVSVYDGATSFSEGLAKFTKRHNQTTYQKKYEGSVGDKFLLELKNEEVFMEIFDSGAFRFSSYSMQGGKAHEKGYLKLANAKKILDRSHNLSELAFAMCTEEDRPELISCFSLSQLSHISTKKKYQKYVIEAAIIIAKSGGDQSNYLDEEIVKSACAGLSKKEASKAFGLNPISPREAAIVFKGGERFTALDVLESMKQLTYGFDRGLEALEVLATAESTEMLTKICKAIVSPKAVDFKALFPRIGNRDDRMREFAFKFLNNSGEEEVEVKTESVLSTVKKAKSLDRILSILGDDAFTKLMAQKPRVMPAIEVTLSALNNVTAEELRQLSTKYQLTFVSRNNRGVVEFNMTTLAQVKKLKDSGMSFSVKFRIYGGSNKADCLEMAKFCHTNQILSDLESEALYLATIYSEPEFMSFIPDIIHVAASCGDSNQLKMLMEHGVSVANSKTAATQVCQDPFLRNYAITKGVRFNNIILNEKEVTRYHRDISKKDYSIFADHGIHLLSEEDYEFSEAVKSVFDDRGNILEFEYAELAGVSVSNRIKIIKALAEKDPRYKKLFTQDISSDGYAIPGPKLIDKAIMTLQNIKEHLGFGIPNLNPAQKSSLETMIVFKSTSLKVIVGNITKLMGLAGLSTLTFDDMFVLTSDSVELSGLATFLLENKFKLDLSTWGAQVLFESVFKDANKNEVVSLLGHNGHYTFDFLKDAIKSVDVVRSNLDKIFAILPDTNASSVTVFDAMSGDNAANALLDECLKGDNDNADVLNELSLAIKNTTVHISVARKRAKAGEGVSIAKEVHDRLGELEYCVKRIFSGAGEAKKLKLSTGLHKLNEQMSSEQFVISDKSGQKYSLYFPENLKETREIGASHGWCTRYNDSYFDSTFDGTAILFNIKSLKSSEIEAQGYVKINDRRIYFDQLKYKNNRDAANDFQVDDVRALLNNLISSNEQLKEKYRWKS